jgi:hypothetical protein
LSLPGSEGSVLLSGSQQGLWLSEDDGKTWHRHEGLGGQGVQVLSAIEDGGTMRVFASVPGPSEQGRDLYSSYDLMTWQKEASGSFRLFESFDRRSVLVVDNGILVNQGTVFRAVGQSPVTLPLGPRNVAGVFDGSGPMVANAGGGTYLADEGGASWSHVIDVWGDLAVAPDFDSGGVILIGGWRDGIFRSSDGGATWQEVLADPSSVVPGINELSVTFLSPDAAIAINPPDRYIRDESAEPGAKP